MDVWVLFAWDKVCHRTRFSAAAHICGSTYVLQTSSKSSTLLCSSLAFSLTFFRNTSNVCLPFLRCCNIWTEPRTIGPTSLRSVFSKLITGLPANSKFISHIWKAIRGINCSNGRIGGKMAGDSPSNKGTRRKKRDILKLLNTSIAAKAPFFHLLRWSNFMSSRHARLPILSRDVWGILLGVSFVVKSDFIHNELASLTLIWRDGVGYEYYLIPGLKHKPITDRFPMHRL